MNKAIRKLVLFFYRLFKMSEEIQFIPDSKIIYYDEVSPLSESRNWGLDLCEIDEAWRLTKGAGIKVAILDTGICKHEDLDGAWSENLVFNCSQDDNWEDKQSSHGCISPQDKIFIQGQGIVAIEDFYNQVQPNEIHIDSKDGFIIKTLDKQNISVLSFNDGNFEHNKIKAVHKLHYVGEIHKVKTHNSQISLTPWHPIYIRDGKKYKKIRADELKIGDNILSTTPTDIYSENFKLFYGKYQKCCECDYITRGFYRKYCRKCNAKDTYKTIEKYVELNEDLAFLTGLIISDGHIMKNDNSIEFCGNDINLVNICFDLFEKIFNITPRKYVPKNRNYFSIRANGVELKKFFVDQLGIPEGPKSLNLILPDIFKKCSDSVFSSFMAGIIEGDGNINKNNWNIRICSGSLNFVNDLKENLLFRGIKSYVSSFEQRWTENLGYHIGFSATPLIAKYLKIKGSDRYLPTTRNFEKITDITVDLYKGELFDLTVDKTANYIANGYVVSNTHVAGIVGARANNVGVVGIAPECTIIPIKVLNNNGGGRYSNIIDGIRLAISPHVDADIITMSLGASSPGPSELHDIIKEATSKGKIILAAAGNDSGPVNYPACYDEVIAVAAVDEHGDFAKFTSSGAQIDSLGPGVNIYSTLIGNKYGLMSGTSQACPFIAGLCALILAYTRSNPDKPQIKNYEDMMVALAKLSDETKYVKMEGEKRWGFGLPKLANRNLETLLQGQ